MFDKSKLTGAAIETKFCGYTLQSPFILASGPLTYGSEGMIRGHQAGCGAVVTKTIRLGAAINPVHHIAKLPGDALINSEKWADSDRLVWYEKEIPEAVRAGALVIGSVGHTPKEARAIVEDVEKAGAQIIELVSYTEETMIPMLDYAKAHVKVPVICKLSGNWANPAASAQLCREHGADGVAAIDSIGPTLVIDAKNRRPLLTSENGFGWMTGAPIKPISMRINAEIGLNPSCDFDRYAMGGVMNATDAIEYLMVGANAVGICSVGILKGFPYIEKMCYDLSAKLKEFGFDDIREAVGVALPNFPKEELISEYDFAFDAEKCIKCKRCETVCSYQARTLSYPAMAVDSALCRSCGLCLDICPTGAISGTFRPQNEKYRAMAQASHDFYDTVKD